MLRLTDLIVDCPDPMALAGFYAAVTGLPTTATSDDDWAGIEVGEVELAFQRVDDFRPPRWPDAEHPKQFHLDFEVDDLDVEQARVVALGAVLVHDASDEEGYGWRVLTDPVGHPFCLCRNRRARWSADGQLSRGRRGRRRVTPARPGSGGLRGRPRARPRQPRPPRPRGCGRRVTHQAPCRALAGVPGGPLAE